MTKEKEIVLTEEDIIARSRLSETKTPNVFLDKSSGKLYIIEFDMISGTHYLNRLN